jgi:drug/metabolite transporter (DMT)-like permease
VTPRRYLVLAAMMIFSACGDVSLSRGMKSLGALSLAHGTQLIPALFNPWVMLGICLLLVFFAAYASSLSWADLTYVVPTNAMGYVLIALLSQFFLHENVTASRWLGILMISCGVGIVAGGPSFTHRAPQALPAELNAAQRDQG